MQLKQQGRRPLLVATDFERVAATEQLQALGEQIDVPVYAEERAAPPLEIGRRLGERGVLVSAERDVWRWVTHYGITSEDIDYTLDAMGEVMRDEAAA